MVTLHVAATSGPNGCAVSAVTWCPSRSSARHGGSFGSQKWAHWRPPGGGEVLRVSFGRDGVPVLHLSDDEILDAVLADLRPSPRRRPSPRSRCASPAGPARSPSTDPHHRAWVDHRRSSLPAGVFVTGASVPRHRHPGVRPPGRPRQPPVAHHARSDRICAMTATDRPAATRSRRAASRDRHAASRSRCSRSPWPAAAATATSEATRRRDRHDHWPSTDVDHHAPRRRRPPRRDRHHDVHDVHHHATAATHGR